MRDLALRGMSRRAHVGMWVATLWLHAGVLWWVLGPAAVSESGAAPGRPPAMVTVYVLSAPSEPGRVQPLSSEPPRRATARRDSRTAPEAALPSTVRDSVATTRTTAPAPIAVMRESPVDESPRGSADMANATDRTAPQVATPRAELADEFVTARLDHGQCPPAAYPRALREQGIEGVVMLRVYVDEAGHAAEVQVLDPSGWRLFDEAALRQVRACRFIPARRGDQAGAGWVEFPVRFVLDG